MNDFKNADVGMSPVRAVDQVLQLWDTDRRYFVGHYLYSLGLWVGIPVTGPIAGEVCPPWALFFTAVVLYRH